MTGSRAIKTITLTTMAIIALMAILMLLPTYDDWNTLSSPNNDPHWQKYFLPIGSFWRPFDALFGYLSALYPLLLFPSLNHVCIVAGHLVSTYLVYHIALRLRFSTIAASVAALFFCICPCVLPTVLACDALNQTYSQLWGLLALLAYLTLTGRNRHIAWAICVLIAALSKENGLAWAVVPPIVGYAFRLTDRRELRRQLLFGIAIAIVYAAVRLSLPHTDHYNPDYQPFAVMKKVKETAVLIATTWLPADYASLVHQPIRNIPLFLLTLLLSLPFTVMLLLALRKDTIRQAALLLLCAIITVSPNILLSLSMMNAYAWMGMTALLAALLTDSYRHRQRLVTTVTTLFILSSTITAVHYWYLSWKSGLMGKEMAQRTIALTGQPVDKAYCLIIEDDSPRFSSICVKPSDTFGWGIAVKHENAYKWPAVVTDTIVTRTTTQRNIQHIARQALAGGYDCVWIVDKNNIKVIR